MMRRTGFTAKAPPAPPVPTYYAVRPSYECARCNAIAFADALPPGWAYAFGGVDCPDCAKGRRDA